MKTPDVPDIGVGDKPEEIKHWLEGCENKSACEWCNLIDQCEKNAIVLAYIQHLESRLAQVERERDAAVKDVAMNKECRTCKNQEIHATCFRKNGCAGCDNTDCPCSRGDSCETCWQWRGVCAENTKEES